MRARIVAVPIGHFRPDPILGRAKKDSGRGHNAREQDRIIRQIVERERRDKEAQGK
jgi:hypothetical protein